MNKKQPASSFYTHHSSWGSYASFIMGKYMSGGGFVLSNVDVPNMNIYLGYQQGNGNVRMLPFYTNNRIGLGVGNFRFQEESEEKTLKTQVDIFSPQEIERRISWCSETWTAGILSFTIYTPFFDVKKPENMNLEESRKYTAPLIMGRLEIDNSESSQPVTALFGLQGTRRLISQTSGRMLYGAAADTRYGFACKAADDILELLSWDIIETAFGKRKNHMLANEGGLAFLVPPKEVRSYDIALGTYQDGIITSNIPAKLYYTNFFSGLEDVLEYGVENGEIFMETALMRDRRLNESGLNSSRRFLLSHATRSYLANTELLVDNKGNIIFVVNEGEYQMMNTLDLTVDQAFWELLYTPWTVRNELEFYQEKYYYHDSIKTSDGIRPGGISFCHDQGVANMFTPFHSSSYEIPDQNHTFSFMTYEELLNWILTAALYVAVTNDGVWLESRREIIEELFLSLERRDNDQDGIMDSDSYKCMEGFEISTYDSLDQSLSQARNNLYLAVKGWATWVCMGKLAGSLNMKNKADRAEEMARQSATTIIRNYNSEEEFIPAVFENCNQSRIIPAIEGLIYPYMTGDHDAVSLNGRYADLIRVLKTHINRILVPGICIDNESGGWKLSSTSRNTWLSKIFLNQYICEKILEIQPSENNACDGAHEKWQKEACDTTAATDQVDSRTGVPLGSRLYPRLVTAILWLEYDH